VFVYFPNGPWYFAARPHHGSEGDAVGGKLAPIAGRLNRVAISLLHLAGITKMTRTLQAISRDRTRVLSVIPL